VACFTSPGANIGGAGSKDGAGGPAGNTAGCHSCRSVPVIAKLAKRTMSDAARAKISAAAKARWAKIKAAVK
jgi:hypothetical protein